MPYNPMVVDRDGRYGVSVEQYIQYQREGYLVVPSLVDSEEVERIRAHAMDIMEGRETPEGVEPLSEEFTLEDRLARLHRIHQLHRVDRVSEEVMLDPKCLDVLEALIGPDVLALQTMMFFNPPGVGGQGWHQDSYYITTYPDTLIGVWIALDDVDEENGCLWIVPGSRNEPIYTSANPNNGYVHAHGVFSDQPLVSEQGISHMDKEANSLQFIVDRSPEAIPVPVKAGDVVYFHGHLIHRSYANSTKDRWRRVFVSHYCNARSWVPWTTSEPVYDGPGDGPKHILARGRTHLSFAQPEYGTICAALEQAKNVSNLKPIIEKNGA